MLKRDAFFLCMRNRRSSIALLIALLLAALPMAAAGQQTLVLEIKGMHCAGCASGIEAMLKRVDGVTRVSVSFEERLATVTYDPARASAEKIIEAIEKMGYKASPKR